tara:strand:- start:293 stop:2704 length:2412 start_codon:yes stop_codon:yes gene_type:complete
MLTVAVDNTSITHLIEEIVQDHSKLNGLSKQRLEQIINFSINHNDYRVLDVITQIHTGIYDYDDRKPEWLESDFTAKKWDLMFDKTPVEIHWDSVYLNDGKRLTDKRHLKLLNSFKYWIAAVDNPLENGGRLISKTTAYQKVNRVITLINSILLHSDVLNLAKYHLLNVNDDFWLSILVKCSERGVRNGIYEPEKRIKALLDNEAKNTTRIDLQNFQEKYPYIARDIVEDDILINPNNREMSCAWLFEQGFYHKGVSIHYSGNSNVMTKLLFDGKILHQRIKFPTYPELHLKEPKHTTEFRAVDNRNNSSSATRHTISTYIDSIRLIHTNIERKDAASPTVVSEQVNATHINQLVNLRNVGRTRTQPPKFVFNLIRQCYDFTKEFLSNGKDDTTLLNEILNILSEAKSKSNARNSNPLRPNHTSKARDKELHQEMADTERGQWFQTKALNLLSNKSLQKGIKQIENFAVGTENRHERIRHNESLFELLSVLQGAIQILVGAIMAKRQDELMKLKPNGNLSPNITPFSEEGAKTEYSLISIVKKTGSRGMNTITERPIPLSIAMFVWELEQFNIKASELKLVEGTLSLFNNLDFKSYTFRNVNSKTFNSHLDALCDYLETELVKYNNGEDRRNYVRQHQLRRFFAMAFFWSKGFDGMDSLRWMLGHSDIEHIYNYISESESGAVLNGAKASVIVRGIVDSSSELAKLDGIEELRKIIAKRITEDTSTPITVETLSEASSEYNEESYLTVPHIKQIRLEQEVETEVIQLLKEEQISLEPEFFTVKDSDGNKTQTFNLILKVKDLD